MRVLWRTATVCMRVAQIVLALGALTNWQGSALAGSDNSNDAWAGDVGLLVLPSGTLIASEYLGYRHGDEYVTSKNNIFGKVAPAVGFGRNIPSTVDVDTSITRLSYITRLWDHPLVFSAAAVFAHAENLNIGNFPVPTGPPGAQVFGPQTVGSSFADPTAFISYGLIVDPRTERFLSATSYFYFPAGNYNKFKQFNFSTAGQYTWVPQIGYAEGLGKFGAKHFWIDVIANASVHSDGDSPLAAAPGVQFDKLTQSNTYDIKAFLRYNFMPLAHIALGIERSWGGDQVASGGLLGAAFGPTSLGKTDFVKGHLQAAMPLTRDFQIAADITHDFERSGGVREDFTAELRLTKFFVPQQGPQSLK